MSLDRAETLPASWYRDPDIWQQERRAIFGREWMLLGRADQVGRPGEYIANTIAGWPVFVLRGKDGTLRGFHNVCRHRAGPLMWDGTGKCSVLRCQYHGWVYDQEGALIRVPDFGDAADFDPAMFHLHPIQVGVWRSLVFVNLDPQATQLDQAMADLTQETLAWPLETFHFHSQVQHDIRCNWKTYVENYAEGYHVPTIHPDLNREIDTPNYRVINKNGYALHQVPNRADANYAGLWIWKWPTLAINIYHNGMNIEQMVPLGHDRTRLIYNFFFRDISAEAEAGNQQSIDFGRVVTEEDIQVCEVVQRNLDAGVYETGRLSPKHENGVWYFQSLVRQALAQAA